MPTSRTSTHLPPDVRPQCGATRWLSHPAFLGVLLAATTLAVYLPAVGFDFIGYDDPVYVSNNPHVQRGLTFNGLVWAFTTGLQGNWHPLTWLSLMADVTLFGKGAAGAHLTNQLLHAANAVLLFLLLLRLTGALWRSAFVAALFALHPLHVESVAWISERKDVLSTFFGFLSLIFYARYTEQSKVPSPKSSVFSRQSILHPLSSINYLLSLGLFALGLMSKPMLVTWPFVMLLLDYWPLGRIKPALRTSRSALLIEKIPFFILSGVLCAVTVMTQKHAGALSTFISIPFGTRIENAFVSYARYLGKTVWPVNLSAFYPQPGHWPEMLTLFAVVLTAGLCLHALWVVRKRPYLVTGWFWFFGTLIPVIGLVQAGRQSMADRYTYVPLIGVFIVLAWAVGEVSVRSRLPKSVPCAFAILLLAACGLRTQNQLMKWRNSETLFRHSITVAGGSDVMYNNLGIYYSKFGQTKQAIASYRQALEIKPNDVGVLNNLGLAFVSLKQYSNGIAYYRDALSVGKPCPEAHHNLADALVAIGRVEEAIPHWRESVRLSPERVDALNNLAWVFATHTNASLRNGSEAVEFGLRAVRVADYSDPEILDTLAAAYAENGRFAEAVETAQKALNLAAADGSEKLAAKIHQHLKSFQAGQPWRE